jgi:unsaturated chondroitin disaccharide hydrolase
MASSPEAPPKFRRLIVRPAVAVVLATMVLAAPAHGASRGKSPIGIQSLAESLRGWRSHGQVRAYATRLAGAAENVLSARGQARLVHALSPRHWALSLDLRLGPRSQVTLRFGTPDSSVELSAKRMSVWFARVLGRQIRLGKRTGWGAAGWRHVELVAGPRPTLAIDGRSVALPGAPGRSLDVRVQGGSVQLAAILASPADDPRALLVHQLAELHARTPVGRSPVSVTPDGRLRFGVPWTTGFWPSALWEAAALTPAEQPFKRWALQATLANLGREQTMTPDLGFIYGRSSVVAYEQLCVAGNVNSRLCSRLRGSGLTAANTLLALAATNPGTGTLPTRASDLCAGCAASDQADTIIDSAAALPLLIWASREGRDDRYRQVALRHATALARLLVRPNGSTIQSVHTRRADGSVVLFHTHQGITTDSTWSRGQAWALYGFAVAAGELGDRRLLEVARRLAGYVEQALPADGVPRWDYDAALSAPHDASAGLITAAGLERLAGACAVIAGCSDGARWRALGERMLNAALRAASRGPPLGYLGDQVYNLHRPQPWQHRAELIFGLDYGLEATELMLGVPASDAATPSRHPTPAGSSGHTPIALWVALAAVCLGGAGLGRTLVRRRLHPATSSSRGKRRHLRLR